jgi:hypothetical protein
VLPCQGYSTHKGAATGWHGTTAEGQLGKAKGTGEQNLVHCPYFHSKFLKHNLKLTVQFVKYVDPKVYLLGLVRGRKGAPDFNFALGYWDRYVIIDISSMFGFTISSGLIN